MKRLTLSLRAGSLLLGMLLALTGCSTGLKPVGIVGVSPVDGLAPGGRAANPTPAPAPVETAAVFPTEGLEPGGRATAASPIPAFPGAEGFGANAVGGRGGRVIEVTNLNDGGLGSLRAALEADGPRIVVFRVAGIIEQRSSIQIRDSYLTVAGQTAPGGGITIKGSGGNLLLIMNNDDVHDVIIRYLRLRRGDQAGADDNLTIHAGHDMIIDHVSMSWSTDENLGIWSEIDRPPIYNITVQRSVMAEGLSDHSNGMHISGQKDYSLPNPIEAWRKIKDLSIHHNLFIHNSHRNPRVISAGTQVINNVVYNWKIKIGETMSASVIDYISNYYKAGPMSNPNRLLLHETFSPDYPTWRFPLPGPSIYITGNIVQPNHPDPNADNWALLALAYLYTPLPESFRRYAPLPQAAVPVNVQAASEAYLSVVADVGANARLDCSGNWVPNSDSVDSRLLADVVNGTGPEDLISSPEEVGGYPEIDSGTPCTDSDHDGMPDAWEQLHCFDPHDPFDGPADADRDGYTNVEEYLNGTVPSAGGTCSRLFFLPNILN